MLRQLSYWCGRWIDGWVLALHLYIVNLRARLGNTTICIIKCYNKQYREHNIIINAVIIVLKT